jgi:ABC-type multidrug transport system ATPase subunit
VDIAICDVGKTYRGGVRALDGVTLDVPRGTFGLLGANGAGKTTLLRILAGILPPSTGSVRVGGHDLASEAGRRAMKRDLGYLPQDLGLYPDLSAARFLDYVGVLKGLDRRAERRDRVEELLDVVGLTEVAGRRLKKLSGGMRRRVGIAQALLNDPRLLIVDEPTAGLDPEERIRFRTLLTRLRGDRTVLLSTHIVEDVAATARDLAVLAGGRLLFRGAVEDLLAAAEGHVFVVDEPTGDVEVVSVVHVATGVRHRVVGEPAGPAQPVRPTLEDAYLWLVRGRGGRSPVTAMLPRRARGRG